jgi:hypothetical protein
MSDMQLPDPREIERAGTPGYARRGPASRYAWTPTKHQPYRTLTDEQIDRAWEIYDKANGRPPTSIRAADGGSTPEKGSS